jgi:hypothetical protein
LVPTPSSLGQRNEERVVERLWLDQRTRRDLRPRGSVNGNGHRDRKSGSGGS